MTFRFSTPPANAPERTPGVLIDTAVRRRSINRIVGSARLGQFDILEDHLG
jgi:hypothetical protein